MPKSSFVLFLLKNISLSVSSQTQEPNEAHVQVNKLQVCSQQMILVACWGVIYAISSYAFSQAQNAYDFFITIILGTPRIQRGISLCLLLAGVFSQCWFLCNSSESWHYHPHHSPHALLLPLFSTLLPEQHLWTDPLVLIIATSAFTPTCLDSECRSTLYACTSL